VTKIKIFNNKYYKYLVIAGILWGFYPLIINQGLLFIGILSLLAGRYVVGFIILYAKNFHDKSLKIPRTNKKLLLYAMCDTVIPIAIYAVGISLSTPLHASIITLSIPFLVYFLSSFVLREPLHKKVVFGGFIATCGLIIVILSKSDSSAQFSLIGDLLIFISGIPSAFAVIFARRIIRTKQVQRPGQLAIYAYMVAAILFSAILIVQIFTNGNIPSIGFHGLFWILISASLGGVVPYLFYLKSAKGLPAEKLADVNYISPVTGIVAAVIITGASFGLIDFFGLVIVLTGLAISNNKLKYLSQIHGVSSFMAIESKLMDKSLEFEKVFVESAKSKF
jgi:drug/metabolite transporter (DMT)-like permease